MIFSPFRSSSDKMNRCKFCCCARDKTNQIPMVETKLVATQGATGHLLSAAACACARLPFLQRTGHGVLLLPANRARGSARGVSAPPPRSGFDPDLADDLRRLENSRATKAEWPEIVGHATAAFAAVPILPKGARKKKNIIGMIASASSSLRPAWTRDVGRRKSGSCSGLGRSFQVFCPHAACTSLSNSRPRVKISESDVG
jgi:hypothetical protein